MTFPFKRAGVSSPSRLIWRVGQPPQAHRLIHGHRHGVVAFRHEERPADRVLVAVEAGQLLAGLRVPEPQRLVLRPREDALAVRRERDRLDALAVAGQTTYLLPAFDVPDAKGAVGAS